MHLTPLLLHRSVPNCNLLWVTLSLLPVFGIWSRDLCVERSNTSILWLTAMCSYRVLWHRLNSKLPALTQRLPRGLSGERQPGTLFSSRHQPRWYTTTATENATASERFNFTTVHKVILASIAGFAIGLKYGLYSESAVKENIVSSEVPSSAFASTYASPEELRLAIQELRDSLPGLHQVDTSEDVLQTYATSENTYHPTSSHAVVVHARSTDDVVKTVNIARKYKVPIITYSGGTSLEGHFSGVGLSFASARFLLK
jgi:hypothetical protein